MKSIFQASPRPVTSGRQSGNQGAPCSQRITLEMKRREQRVNELLAFIKKKARRVPLPKHPLE